MKAHVEIRTQRSRGSSSHMFGGPDHYVAVQVVPEGIEKLTYLNQRVAKFRNIDIIYCGEGYGEHRGPKSMLGQALEKAKEITEEINNRAVT